MEKWNLAKNGTSRLPPGFRFQPTDEELVFQYLKCKILSYPLPASFIPHLNVCNYDPWDLPGNWELEEERYLFSKKEAKYRNGNRMNRTTKSGYWKATGSDKKICPPSHYNDINHNVFGGIRKTLVFYQGKAPNGFRTNWVMHEYRLLAAQPTTLNSTHLNYVEEVGDWVLCRMCLKKRSRSTETETNGDVAEPRLFDFMRVQSKGTRGSAGVRCSITSSSCSSSSGIAEVCSSVADHQETTGYTSSDS